MLISDETYEKKIKKSLYVNYIDNHQKLLDFFKYLINNFCTLIRNLKYYLKIHYR